MTIKTVTLTACRPTLLQEGLALAIPGSFEDVWSCLESARGIIEPAVDVAQKAIASIEQGADYEEAIAHAIIWERYCHPGALDSFLALTCVDSSLLFEPEMLSVTARLLENV